MIFQIQPPLPSGWRWRNRPVRIIAVEAHDFEQERALFVLIGIGREDRRRVVALAIGHCRWRIGDESEFERVRPCFEEQRAAQLAFLQRRLALGVARKLQRRAATLCWPASNQTPLRELNVRALYVSSPFQRSSFAVARSGLPQSLMQASSTEGLEIGNVGAHVGSPLRIIAAGRAHAVGPYRGVRSRCIPSTFATTISIAGLDHDARRSMSHAAPPLRLRRPIGLPWCAL